MRGGQEKEERNPGGNSVFTWRGASGMDVHSFTAQREGTRQKASLALLNFFGGSLGEEGEAQKLPSGF